MGLGTAAWYSDFMKIVSWNVNGIRAVVKKGAWAPFMQKTQADIILLQETKAQPEQVPPEVSDMPGFYSYFDCPKERKGYSGVGLLTKIKPQEVFYELGVPALDIEGRLITTLYDGVAILNVYFPNGGRGPDRLEFKLAYYDAFLTYIDRLRKEGYKVIFAGDINTAHEAIDLARPKENEENTGFLPEERAWLDEVERHGYIDTFRHFDPNKTGAYSYWDLKTAARDRNVGWRIDYVFASPELLPNIKRAFISSEIYGSDHCPIGIELENIIF
jgi:exodeoxyribonuclease-3